MQYTPLEIAAGIPLEADPQPARLPPTSVSPRAALEAAILPALRSGRCAVSFSGGVDSSAVLCVATAVARREGLPEPLPVTYHQRGLVTEDERYAALVVEHLGLERWERIALEDELDLLGDLAIGCVRRHGVTWPASQHFAIPMHALGEGYHLLDGYDGDTLFAHWRARRGWDLLTRRARPETGDLRRVFRIVAPRRFRRRRSLRGEPVDLPWLRPPAREEVARAWASLRASEPARWDRRVAWYAGLRWLQESLRVERLVAAEAGWSYEHPFLEPAFLSALARDGGWSGYGSRGQAMAHLFGDVMPADVIWRKDKVGGTATYWGPRSRAWASRWDGSGVDVEIVDPAALRHEWGLPHPSAYSELLLQQTFVAAGAPDLDDLLE